MERPVRSLCVFDLDGTLIPYDSFAKLVREQLWQNPSLLWIAILRRFRLLDRVQFAGRAQMALQNVLSSAQHVERICHEIQSAINKDRLALVKQWQSQGATVILLSASPAAYVVPLGQKLGFDHAFGSSDSCGTFQHLHGIKKRQFVDQKFPINHWRRAFAIADHPSDETLLDAFEQVERV